VSSKVLYAGTIPTRPRACLHQGKGKDNDVHATRCGARGHDPPQAARPFYLSCVLVPTTYSPTHPIHVQRLGNYAQLVPGAWLWLRSDPSRSHDTASPQTRPWRIPPRPEVQTLLIARHTNHDAHNPTTDEAMHMKRRKSGATTKLSVSTEGLIPAGTG